MKVKSAHDQIVYCLTSGWKNRLVVSGCELISAADQIFSSFLLSGHMEHYTFPPSLK